MGAPPSLSVYVSLPVSCSSVSSVCLVRLPALLGTGMEAVSRPIHPLGPMLGQDVCLFQGGWEGGGGGGDEYDGRRAR